MHLISQSLFKNLRYPKSIWNTVQENSGCNAKELALFQVNKDEPFEVYSMPLLEPPYEKRTSLPMLLGLEFERELIGASRDGNAEGHAIPRNKNGSMKAAEIRMREAAMHAKQLVQDFKIKFTKVQPQWKTKYWVGHPDAPHAIIDGVEVNTDIKYSEIKKSVKGDLPPKTDYFYNKYHPWHEGLHIQALTYTVMDYVLHGKILPFYFLIFRPFGKAQETINDKGKTIEWQPYTLDIRRINFSFSKHFEKLEQHADEMEAVGKLYQSGDFPKEKNPTPENCVNCPFICDKRAKMIHTDDMDMML